MDYINTKISGVNLNLEGCVLTLDFEKPVNSIWMGIFKNGNFDHDLVMGYNTNAWSVSGFRTDGFYSISCGRVGGEELATRLIEHVKKWIIEVDKEYNKFVDRECARIVENKKLEEEKQKEEKEITDRLNESLKK